MFELLEDPMPADEMTSRERMLNAMRYEPTDHTPCSFMMFHGLRDRYPGDPLRFVEEQTALGLDAVVELPEFPMSIHPEVTWRNWAEPVPGSPWPVLHKEYDTPAGKLLTTVRTTDDWPHGNEIELYSDFNVPRSRRFHVNGRPDLKAFRYLLMPPTRQQAAEYREQCGKLKDYAARRGLMTRGVRGVLIDAAIRFAGVENLIYAAVDDPGYLEELLEIIWNWNMARMEIVLDEKPDMFLRRAWYENGSFWSKDMFRQFMKGYLVKEVQWAHQSGSLFGYINTCSYMHLLDDFTDIGFDVLIGVDPVEDKRLDMAALKAAAQGRFALWGGCSGFVTVEAGTEPEVIAEVDRAMDVLASGGGFILSPVDNVRSSSARAMANARALIARWKERTGANA
jgi:hypothetical protein